MSDHELKEKAAAGSVAASLGLTLAKLTAGFYSGSLALLSEAAHGAVDTAATLVTWHAVRQSGKPADEDHHFGHDKFEALAALVETFLLFAVALVVVWEAARRIAGRDATVEVTPWVFGVLGVSILVDLVRWRSLARVARETKSDALAADATHFSSDLAASLIVLAGLLAYLKGWRNADAYASFGVAAFVAIAGWRLARRTVDTLLDKAPEGIAGQLRQAARMVPGVTDIDSVRLRRLGGRVAGDMSIGVSRMLAIEQVNAIKNAVAQAVRASAPDADITVIASPRALDDETIVERVLLTAARKRLPVHHVTIQRVKDRVSISFDLELDGRMPHGEAHDIATRLEEDIKAELGAGVEVESHIEPLETRELEGRNAPDIVAEAVATRLGEAAGREGVIYDIHKVRVRETPAGLVVNFHCRVDPALSVDAVHACVDAIEGAVRRADPAIIRLVGHAEPPRLPSPDAGERVT